MKKGIMKRYRADRVLTIAELYELEDGEEAKVSGQIIYIKKMSTKDSNQPMAVIEIEDDENQVEVIISPEAYEKWSVFIKYNAMVIVSGKVSQKHKDPAVIAESITPQNVGLPDEPGISK